MTTAVFDRTKGRLVTALLTVVMLVAGLVTVSAQPASAAYRYDCSDETSRSNTHVVHYYMATNPSTGEQVQINLECGIPGAGGYGLRHIVKPTYPQFENGEIPREHFGGYLSDWESILFTEALAGQPVLQPSGNWRYDASVPIFELPNYAYLGTQQVTVIVDWRPYPWGPAQIKTAWGNPEDIRTITGEEFKTRDFKRPWGM